MDIKNAKCTNCGAILNVNAYQSIIQCEYCHTSNVVEQALNFGKLKIDHTDDILSLRKNLTSAIKDNNIQEIKRLSAAIQDLLPDDFIATYFHAYALASLGQVKPLRDFYKAPKLGTYEQIQTVVNHITENSDLRDEPRIIEFLNRVKPDFVDQFKYAHQKRVELENQYAPVPRDVFICFSSYDEMTAEKAVEAIEKEGFTCWISTRNLRPNDSENYWSNIEKAIKNSRLFLVISSQKAMLSKDVQEEIDIASKHKKRMFEYKVDSTPHTILFKHVFNGIKWVDGINHSASSLYNLSIRVYEEIRAKKITKTEHSKLKTSKILKSKNYINKIKTNSLKSSVFERTKNKDTHKTNFLFNKPKFRKYFTSALIFFALVFTVVFMFTLRNTNTNDPIYTVNYIDYEETLIATYEVKLGENAPLPLDPIRESYIFDGWSQSHENVSNDLDIYAQYIKDEREDYYTFNSNTKFITGYSGPKGGHLEIPSNLDGLDVVGIGEEVFYDMELSSISIPDTITSIGDRAFKNNQITNITIPKNVKRIGHEAFSYNKLISVTIPETVTIIGEGAFRNNLLSSVTIPDSIILIADNTFRFNKITSITIPKNVTKIGDGAFRTNQLTSVSISENVERIGVDAFSFNLLSTVNIPENVKIIDAAAFSFNQLTTVKIPENVETIGADAFSHNELTRITLTDEIFFIGENAFGFNKITRVVISGNKLYFNEIWNNIGLPINLRPEE